MDVGCITRRCGWRPGARCGGGAERGVRLLALTDHDTLDGLDEAAQAQTLGMQLVNGIELSLHLGGRPFHVPGFMPLTVMRRPCGRPLPSCMKGAGCALRKSPNAWKPRACLELEGARALQQELGDSGNAPARPHFADFLVHNGYVKDRAEAVRKWLGSGKLGDVKQHWHGLAQAVDTLRRAGAWVSLAHPWQYDFTRSKRNS